MTKKIIIILLVPIILIIVVFILRFGLGGSEDTWLCQNGQWVKHGQPSAPQPTTGCGQSAEQNGEVVKIFSPLANAAITSPLLIKGEARGFWFFEASFPVKLIDAQGKTLAQTVATAESDWMTEKLVPFSAELEFINEKEIAGYLVFQRDNPSGLPANDAEIKWPVKISASPGHEIKLYFSNSQMDPSAGDCQKVFGITRKIPNTQIPGRWVLELLIAGPSETEKQQGYFSSINSDTWVKSLIIKDGVARADFSAELEKNSGGSCRVAAIRAQITETLKQFETVKSVIISVEGNVEEALQP